MKYQRLFFLFAFALCCLFIETIAQTTGGFIVGRVTERTTGQPVGGARVAVEGRAETVSDPDGNFRLTIGAGAFDVRVSAPGFSPVIKNQIVVTGGRDTVLDTQLDAVAATATVEVRSEIFAENAEQPLSNTTLNREEIRQTPGTGGDPLRAINSLPAVSAASAEFADLIVRGGTPEENLTFVDNIPVADFTYFTDKYDQGRGGRAAILAPDVFDRLEFSAGGFGVRYGDKMSSALDVRIREANRRRVQGVIFADSGTAGGSLDVPLGRRGGWLFSARRSYIDVALDVAGIADQGIIGYPRTFDFTNKIVYDLTPRHKLSLTALGLSEDFDQTAEQSLRIDRRNDRFVTRRTSRRLISGVTLSSALGAKTLAQTTAWLNVAHNDGSFARPDGFRTLQRSRDLRDSQFGVKEEVTGSPARNLEIAAGGGLYFDQADYFTFENTGRFSSPLEEEFNAPARQNRLRLDTKTSAYAYFQTTWRTISSRLALTPGVRVDRYGVTGETLASPRFAARFGVNSKTALTFAAGVYRQPPSLFVLSLAPGNRDLKAQRATHVIGGVEWLPREDLRVRFEAYQKSYDDLIVRPAEPTQNFVLTGNYFNSGEGATRGLEFSLEKALTGFLAGQASYAYVDSRRRFRAGGFEFPSGVERPHQLTLIGITRFYGFSLAAKYRLASGLPYTRRTPLAVPTAPGAFLQRIALETDTNALRLPHFANLDVRAEKRFSFRRWSFSPYIDVFNLTNHDSVVEPNYEFFDPFPQFLRENKRFPIFGMRIEF